MCSFGLVLRRGAERSICLHFNEPGKPTQNAQIESLNGKIRDELLNAHSFVSIFEARALKSARRLRFLMVTWAPRSKPL